MAEQGSPLMTTAEAAEYIKLKPKTLRNMLYSGRGPRSYRIGGRRRFRVGDLDAWIDKHAADHARRTRRAAATAYHRANRG